MLPPSMLLLLAVSGVGLAVASPSATTGSGVVRALSTLQRLDWLTGPGWPWPAALSLSPPATTCWLIDPLQGPPV